MKWSRADEGRWPNCLLSDERRWRNSISVGEKPKCRLQTEDVRRWSRTTANFLVESNGEIKLVAAMLPRDYGGFCIQMRLQYSPFAPFLLHLIEWMDYRCTDPLPSFLGLFHILLFKVYVDGKPLVSPRERTATLTEFYAVIYPSLRQLQNGHVESKDETSYWKRIEDQNKVSSEDHERDEECGICMENCRDVVLPNCGHSMCLSCFQDWSARSRSCPFCRNCLKRLSTRDLWVLTSDTDVVDLETLAKENLLHFYLYIENMSLFQPDMNVFIPDYML